MARTAPKQRKPKHEARGERINCSYCPAHTTMLPPAARFKGWRIYSGSSVTGAWVEDVICPEHRKTTRTATVEIVKPIKGQLELF